MMGKSLWPRSSSSSLARVAVMLSIALLAKLQIDQSIQPLDSYIASRYDHVVEVGPHNQTSDSAVKVTRIVKLQSDETKHPASNWTLQNSSAPKLLINDTSSSPAIGSVPSRSDNMSVSLFEQFEQQYTPAQRCRLDLEKWLNPLIDEFLGMGEAMPPLMDWVWDMGSHYIISLKFDNWHFSWVNNAYLRATWNWQDQYGNNFTIDKILGNYGKRLIPLLQINVPPFNASLQTEPSRPVFLWATNVQVPENKTVQIHPWMYDLRPFLKCDRIEINDDRPRPGSKIGMCVKFRGGHHLIPPFIAYHRLIGVDHFWFYANEEFNITDLPQAPDVTYVPYRFVWSEHVDKSSMEIDGVVRPWKLPFGGASHWQPQAMQQCLYRLKRYGLDWMMTNDVDEYLWVNKTESSKLYSVNVSVLQDFLLPYENMSNVGGLSIDGWAFGANESKSKALEFDIDYVYRSQQVSGGRIKIIYRVPMAKRINVHWLYDGGDLLSLPPSDIRWNHYRRPQDGIFQRGKNAIVKDSSLPDTYRKAMVESMKNDIYPHRENQSKVSMG